MIKYRFYVIWYLKFGFLFKVLYYYSHFPSNISRCKKPVIPTHLLNIHFMSCFTYNQIIFINHDCIHTIQQHCLIFLTPQSFLFYSSLIKYNYLLVSYININVINTHSYTRHMPENSFWTHIDVTKILQEKFILHVISTKQLPWSFLKRAEPIFLLLYIEIICVNKLP